MGREAHILVLSGEALFGPLLVIYLRLTKSNAFS